MSVESIEASEESSQPRELITIAYGTTTHRITTGTRDIMYDDNIYYATAAARGEISVVPIESESELAVTLPVNHAFVRRYLRQFMPPQLCTVTLRRLYLPSGDIETAWIGDITSMSIDDENTTATFRVPSKANDAAQRLLPTLSVARACPYTLYGAGCTVSRTASVDGLAHKVTASVIYVNGRDVQVDLASTDRLDDWSVAGELVVASGEASGERGTIRAQTDLNPPFSGVVRLSLRFPIPGLKIGDSVEVYAGCDHLIETCVAKFDNRQNFGGYPSIPTGSILLWRR